MHKKRRLTLLSLFLLGSCATTPPSGQMGSPPNIITPSPLGPAPLPAAPRVSGAVSPPGLPPLPSASYATMPPPPGPATNLASSSNGDISFNFANTDIRTVVDQILGGILHVNYTIDPGVSGTATLRTVAPLTIDQVIPTLQTLLAQNNAVLVQSNGIYRVMAADQANATPSLAGGPGLGGGEVLPLQYASAQQLATILQPYVAKGGAIIADPNSNSLIIQGDPATRAALVSMVQAFDIDALAGQSYELFPVAGGDAQDFATAFQGALVKQGDAKTASTMSVVPLTRIGAVLVIARSQSQLSDAARVYSVLNQVQRETMRTWHVYYLRNSRANDAAYLLQEAFTPDEVTAQPTPAATQSSSSGFNNNNDSSGTGSNSTTTSSTTDTNSSSGLGSSSGTTDQTSSGTDNSASTSSTSQNSTSGAAALLGPLSSTGNNSNNTTSAIRIIPDTPNNALLIYATPQEDDQIEGMLAKLDIVPLQVRIDATIAEVDLTGALQYGTQFYFKSGDINAVLSNASTAALDTSFPGFVLSGAGSDAAPLAISALQSVTKVRVLSAPELMVLDGQAASLQVGDDVPYLAQTSQSTLTSTSQVINSIDYRETGVILRVTPHVGSDGLVTLDLDQEVSGVATTSSSGIDSPTFTERTVQSRVAIQDGQTVGLAGLISDNNSQGNSGIPGLKNIPLLGGLFGTQDNSRTREELLVLITPHVIRSQQQALDLTADMQQQLPSAAQVPAGLQSEPFEGSADPDAAWRARQEQGQ
jgi:general secretion pathway protein D